MQYNAFLKKWVKALRSDKYKQGRNCLHDPESRAYCCLGVALHLKGIDNTLLMESIMPGDINATVVEGSSGRRIEGALAMLNDSEVPFEVIAGVIHENLVCSRVN